MDICYGHSQISPGTSRHWLDVDGPLLVEHDCGERDLLSFALAFWIGLELNKGKGITAMAHRRLPVSPIIRSAATPTSHPLASLLNLSQPTVDSVFASFGVYLREFLNVLIG
jgi:hypothetical protein